MEIYRYTDIELEYTDIQIYRYTKIEREVEHWRTKEGTN